MKRYIRSQYDVGESNYNTMTVNGKRFGIHSTIVDNSPDANSWELFKSFKATVRMIAPYDDADYFWAKLHDGKIEYFRNGKRYDTSFYTDAEDMDVDNNEWIDEILYMCCEELVELNKDIQPRIIHN